MSMRLSFSTRTGELSSWSRGGGDRRLRNSVRDESYTNYLQSSPQHSVYNRPAPAEWISFLIGGIFGVISFIYWVVRVRRLKRAVGGSFNCNTRLRVWISAFIDNDAPVYTISKMYAQSFFFLGGLQYNYSLAFSVMLGVFALESTLDSLRVILAFTEANSIADVVLTSITLAASLRDNKLNASTHKALVQLKPHNVYEDISRDKLIVLMVFITQAILIAFVVRTNIVYLICVQNRVLLCRFERLFQSLISPFHNIVSAGD